MNIKKKRIIFLISIVVVILIGGKVFIYDNPKFLYIVAEGLDEPSSMYYFVIERIYKLSANETEINRISKELESGKNEYLHSLYVRTLGIVGGSSDFSNYILVKTYSKYQDNDTKSSIVYAVIDSMGFIGNESTRSILERLLHNYENHNMVVAKYPIARALYLSTGDASRVRQISSLDFIETEDLKMAKDVLVESAGRYRSISEMLILANLNRPDKYKYKE